MSLIGLKYLFTKRPPREEVQEDYKNEQPLFWEDEYIDKAFNNYNGSIAFDYWLNLPTTTRSMMRVIENTLLNKEHIVLKYLSRIGRKAEIQEAGILVGKIYAMLPISVIREVYYNFHNSVYTNDKLFHRDCMRLISILEISYPRDKVVFVIKEMLEKGKSIGEISNGIIIRFFKVSELRDISKIYSKQIRKPFFAKLHSFLSNDSISIDLIAGFCLGFLFKLKLLNSKTSVYRSKVDYIAQLNKIFSAYKKFIYLDSTFALTHLQCSIMEFLRNESRIVERLHWFFITKQFFKLSFQAATLMDIKMLLENYSQEHSVKIYLDEKEFVKVYDAFALNRQGWANKKLETVLSIELE